MLLQPGSDLPIAMSVRTVRTVNAMCPILARRKYVPAAMAKVKQSTLLYYRDGWRIGSEVQREVVQTAARA